MIDLKGMRNEVAQEALVMANARIRILFSGEDTVLGARIVSARSEGREFATLMATQWTPIRWLRGQPGFTFEIGQPDFSAMGQDALDPAIDDAVLYATIDAITAHPGFIGELIRDIALGNDSDIYEVDGRPKNGFKGQF